MQHAACIDHLDIPWILQEVAFCIPVFGGEVSLIFLIIDLQNDLNSWPINSLILPTGPWMTQLSSFSWFRTSLALKVSNFLSSLIDFTEIRPVLACIDCIDIQIRNYSIYLIYLIMPKPVYLMTVQEAHKEFNTLTDQIRAKYKLLDSI